MSCGLPIISANGAYNDDILSDEYSIRTDPNDINGMIEAIKLLRDNTKQREMMSKAALNASMRFDITDRASSILDFMHLYIKERK